jgi:predicted secreted hydrolase
MAQGGPMLVIPDDVDPEPETRKKWWYVFFLLWHLILDNLHKI